MTHETSLTRAQRLEAVLIGLLSVMPVLPDAAKQIVGMEDRYNSMIAAAKKELWGG